MILRSIYSAPFGIFATELIRPNTGSPLFLSIYQEISISDPADGFLKFILTPICFTLLRDKDNATAAFSEPAFWTSNFTDFGRARDTLLATDALSVRLGGTQLNRIESVCVSHKLFIFTTGSEWTLSCNGPLSLDTVELVQQSSCGASEVSPVLVGNRCVFVQAGGEAVRDFVYDYASASYISEDLTLRAKHLVENRRMVQLSYA